MEKNGIEAIYDAGCGKKNSKGEWWGKKRRASSEQSFGFGMNVIQDALEVQKAFLEAVLRVRVMMNPSPLPFNSIHRDHVCVKSVLQVPLR